MHCVEFKEHLKILSKSIAEVSMKQKMNCFLLIYHCTYLNLAVRKFVNAGLDYRLDVLYTLYILIKFELYNSLANAH